MRTLYICYFGLREPLVQTQVLPYLRELCGAGVGVRLLTFEPDMRRRWPARELEAERARLAAEGVEWFCLPYHSRPSVPATAYDILRGAWFAGRMARRERLDALHARAHVPAAMAMLARAMFRARVRFVFDIRGLMAEEYADAGVWSEKSLPYRAVKRLERAAVRSADGVVVLTRRMRDWLVAERLATPEKITVIPCCVDFSRYAAAGEGAAAREDEVSAARVDEGSAVRRGGGERFEVVYAGSVTGLYMLEEMGRFFAEVRAREPRAFLRILTTSSRERAAEVLRRAGLGDGDFWVGGVPAAEVPAYLSRARLGLSFRKPTFSQIAASPTKIPEYLAAGLPVVSNSGIGDTDELLEAERVGVLVREFNREAYARAAREALRLAAEPGVGERCAEAARKYFDLKAVGGARYAEVYRRLGVTRPRA
ncbi:MAG TPA: glycosyltransferase [Pyrinomonadaceae bacterium]|nr:glycosyltransferase [Pyrinomonadaceae bacterium]